MLFEKKYFGAGQGNFDDADFILLPNQWVNLENARVGSTDKGVIGTIESVGSNVLKSPIEPSVTNVVIGSVEDEANNRILYFVADLYGNSDKILCYSIEQDVIYTVLLSSQVIGGLNFDKNLLIQCKITGNLLYWTDNSNRQCKINVDAGIKLNDPSYLTDEEPYTQPLNKEVISLLKRPPLLPVNVVKDTLVGVTNNFVKNDAVQFSSRYYYRDGETSVLSVYSELAPYNITTDTFNSITVTFDPTEIIDQDVQRVDLVVRYGETNNFAVIKTWDKNSPTELAEIIAHNDGSTPLTYVYLNDKKGEALDGPYVVKQFESIPITTKTLEIARNRLYLGNNIIGYDPPITTSLGATFQVQEEGADIVAIWYDVKYPSCPGGTLTSHAGVHITGTGANDGYYDVANSALWFTTPIAWAELAFIGTSLGEVQAFYGPGCTIFGFPVFGSVTDYPSLPATVTGAPFTVNLNGLNCFKTEASYQLGVVFYDFGDRKSGVLTSDEQIYVTPDRAYDTISFATNLNWTLDNSDAANEIPIWATHYSIVISKCLRTRFFLQTRVKNLTYVTKDADGLYVFNTSAYAANLNGIGVDITLLNSNGMGYVFAEGDLVKLYLDGASVVYTLAIVGQDGNWIICELADIGAIGNTASPYLTALFEIYTPYQPFTNEPLYEVAQTYMITNPGTDVRAYSVTGGSIGGDIYILARNDGANTFFTENMSPNDKYYLQWYTDAGRPNFIDNIGQSIETNTIAYSNVYITGSRVNGLSSFEALNEKTIPLECGAIQKLQVTSKVANQQGIVMLSICTDETASLYIEEVQQYGSSSEATLTVFSDVIGTINVLKGSFGTLNPESVTEFRGNVYWVDVQNGKVIQYSLNGLFPISNYKMTRYWKQFCDQFLAMTQEEIEALGSRPFIFTTVDPHHWELLVTVPKLLEVPPKGYLPDPPYTDYIYPYDIWDGQSKTLVYKINAEPNFWQGSYSFTQEGYAPCQNKLYSFKYGQLYEHNITSSYCEFNGVQYKSRLMFVCNQQPERDKVYDNISLAANMLPTLAYFMSLSPFMQVSNLQDFDWEQRESMLYSQIYRNILTPSATGLQTNALITGEKMRTYAIRVMLEFTVNTTPLELRFVTLGYQLSLGHSIPTQ